MHFRQMSIAMVFGAMVSSAVAEVQPVADLQNLTQASTLIIVGELASVQRDVRTDTIDSGGTPIKVRVQRGTFRIDQVLKGDQQSPFTSEIGVPFEIGVANVAFGWTIPPEHAYGLFFFKQTAGILVFTDFHYGWIPLVRGINVIGDTPLERVVNTLGAIISVPDSTLDMKKRALTYLQFDTSSASATALRAALSSADPTIGVHAAAALAMRGDASGLEVIKRVFLPGPRPLPNKLEETVPNAILVGLRDPKLIPDLEELLYSSSRYMRRGVVQALMKTGSPNALNGLRRALGDPDFEVRYYGVLGLARMTDGDGAMAPSIEQFRADEIKYVSYWRERPAKRESQTSPRNQE